MSDEKKNKVFRPKLIPTLVTLLILGVTCTAGTWQMRRYKEQTARTVWYHQQHDVLPTVTSLAETAQAKDRLEQLHFRRAALTGKLDMAHAQLLTARVGAGNQLGYDIIVPLQVEGGAHASLLVNLGWAPPEKLPDWVTEKPMEDEGALTFPQSEMTSMLADYYRVRGWGELPA